MRGTISAVENEVEKRTFVILTLRQMTLLLPKIKLLGVESVVVIISFFHRILRWLVVCRYYLYDVFN